MIKFDTILPWVQHTNSKTQINGLVQERCNSSALAMVLCLFCTNPSKCDFNSQWTFITGRDMLRLLWEFKENKWMCHTETWLYVWKFQQRKNTCHDAQYSHAVTMVTSIAMIWRDMTWHDYKRQINYWKIEKDSITIMNFIPISQYTSLHTLSLNQIWTGRVENVCPLMQLIVYQ